MNAAGRICTHCGQPGSKKHPLENVGDVGESGPGSTVYAHKGCRPSYKHDPGPTPGIPGR